MTTKKDILNFSQKASEFLTGVGKVIVETKKQQIKTDVLNKYQQAKQSGKLLFNEDGSPRNPFEINADYQQLINVGNLLGDKSLTEGLLNDYKMQVAQIGNRQQNQLYADVLEKINPDMAAAFKGMNLDYTKIPQGLVKPKIDPLSGKLRYTKTDGKPYQDENGNWVYDYEIFDRASGQVVQKETRQSYQPNLRINKSTSSSFNTSLNVTPQQAAFLDDKGQHRNLTFKNGKYYDEGGKHINVAGWKPITENQGEFAPQKQKYQSPQEQGAAEWKQLESIVPEDLMEDVKAYLNGDRSKQEAWDKLSPDAKIKASRSFDLINGRHGGSVEW